MRKAFKAEKENLDLVNHEWALAGIEAKILQEPPKTAGSEMRKSKKV